MTTRDVFSNNLKAALDARGVSQLDLALAAGVSSATVSYWCNGRKYPRPDKMQTIADYLHVTMSWLMTGEAEDISMFTSPTIEERYAALDAHGKAIVDAIMALEEKRMEAEK